MNKLVVGQVVDLVSWIVSKFVSNFVLNSCIFIWVAGLNKIHSILEPFYMLITWLNFLRVYCCECIVVYSASLDLAIKERFFFFFCLIGIRVV